MFVVISPPPPIKKIQCWSLGFFCSWVNHIDLRVALDAGVEGLYWDRCPVGKALFKRCAIAVPNFFIIDRIKFYFSTAVARRLKPSRATAM